MKSHRLINPFLAVVTGLGLMLALPALAASAPDAGKEIKTAAEHAGFAMKSKSTGDVHKHLHHVINCLVGANGEGFDAAVGDPCKGMGEGALKDASGSEGAEGLLNQSLRLARIGVEIGDHRAAQAVAVATRDLLRLAEKDGKAHGK
jgi:hypothetical protein